MDDKRLPVGICLLQRAWREATLIKLASAIEDLRNHTFGWRPLPEYRNCQSKRMPILDLHPLGQFCYCKYRTITPDLALLSFA